MRTFKTVQVLLCAMFIFMGIKSHGQKAPMKFGKVDMADLQMTTYPLDTSAAAVVLCKYGYFSLKDYQTSTSMGVELMFTQQFRIKILRKEGLSYGDRIVYGESKANIRGITFNLENGKVVESKLKNESIFKERVTEDRYRFRLAMPNVKEGSVIDIEVSYPGFFSSWYFQEKIPVRWSELIIEPSQYVEFRRNYYGYIPLAVNTDMRWVAKDVPAFKVEPFINSEENYISKFEIDVLRITFPGHFKEYTTTWEAVNRRLDESDYFGNTMQLALFLNTIAKEIELKYTRAEDKIKAAFEAVKVVKWNENVDIYTTSTTLSYPFNKKIGNCADINLILVQLLKKLDFDAYPVVMSTRSNGQIRPFAPSLDRLNYVVACIKTNENTMVLDATEELMPHTLLPKRALNERGRTVDSKKTDWVEISTNKKDKEFIQANLSFDGTEVLKGKYTYNKVDYAAFYFRKKYSSFNGQDEYLKDFESSYKGVVVENFNVKDIDSIYKPVVAEYDVKIKNRVNVLGDLLYVNPMLFEQTTTNPFKLEDRQYPVDYAHPIEQVYMLTLNIPEGYQVDQLPKPLIIKMPENAASCVYQVSNLNNLVQVMFKFSINKPVFLQAEYQQLKAFYDEVIKKQAELVVLKKI